MEQQEHEPKRVVALNERGFTVVEVVVAALVFLIGTSAVFGAVRQLVNDSARSLAGATAVASVDKLATALEDDASTGLAVYNPDDDTCTGSTSGDVTVYYKANGGSGEAIAYHDDGNGTVTRTVVSTGTATDYAGTSLAVRCLTATSLVGAENLAPNLPGIVVHDYPVNVGTDAQAKEQNGGNRVVIAQVASTQGRVARELHLFAGSIPTGFTIIGPQWHVTISREDHTRRFAFGLGQISWLRILVQIDVSYDDWQTRSIWCNWEDIEVYGAAPRFNTDDIPVYAGAPDADPIPYLQAPYEGGAHTWALTPDLYPETLLQYCRAHFGEPPQTPGGASPAPATTSTSDDITVDIPPWWVWQNCGPSMTCPAGTQPPATCDPTTGVCTVPPATPPPGWDAWCAQWSPPIWGQPQFGAPCPAATPPPTPPPAPTPPPRNTTTYGVSGTAYLPCTLIDPSNLASGNTCGAGWVNDTVQGAPNLAFTTATGNFFVTTAGSDTDPGLQPVVEIATDPGGSNLIGTTNWEGVVVPPSNPDGSIALSPGPYYVILAEPNPGTYGEGTQTFSDVFNYTVTIADE